MVQQEARTYCCAWMYTCMNMSVVYNTSDTGRAATHACIRWRRAGVSIALWSGNLAWRVSLTGASVLPPSEELAHRTPSSCCCRCSLALDKLCPPGAKLMLFTARAAACGLVRDVPTWLVWNCLVNILAGFVVVYEARIARCMHASMQAYV
jgi:hypothetical protein